MTLFDAAYHYPADLFRLLVDTIPLLCPSKADVLTFFRGAGVPPEIFADFEARVAIDREGVSKYEMVRVTLERLNNGDALLAARREVIKRVVEFDHFATLWPNDQPKAQAGVANIQRLVGVKDTWTRIRQHQTDDERRRAAERRGRAEAVTQRQRELSTIYGELCALFDDRNAQRRGRALEQVLNRMFAAYDILVSNAFTVKSASTGGIVEQIDGAIELDSHLYLVEMKWWKTPLGGNELAPHLLRVNGHAEARGIFIAYPGYTESAIQTCRDMLVRGAVVALTGLDEFVRILEVGADLVAFLRAKVRAAQLNRTPWVDVPIP
ncbi:MAG TPA: hypothetical protein VK679_19390 [Gemmatimonadaceae bacterium]|jgi:restriction system protein|nr:hypothetical protein [Gemmatimonadaceae bacterium]